MKRKLWLATVLPAIFPSLLMASGPNTNYCVAVRGNGENVAAHWAGLSRIVEEAGMPKGAAGGSSATVTLFLLDSVAQNPIVAEVTKQSNNSAEFQRRSQALLLKSMPAYILHLLEAENIPGVYNFTKEIGSSDEKFKKALKGVLTGASEYKEVLKAFKHFGPLINSELLGGLKSPSTFLFYKQQIMDAINMFGRFDIMASVDDNLFIRPGLVDFKYFALWIGTIGDFYAANINEDQKLQMRNFLLDCSDRAYHKSWQDEDLKQCREDFEKLAKSYVARDMEHFPHKRIFEKVGSALKTFPTTAVLMNGALQRYKDLTKEYQSGKQNPGYKTFSVDINSELAYGYWGPSHTDLLQMEQGLKSFQKAGDLKSSRFKSLGTGNWFEVLATSPAEPGLTNFQKIPLNANLQNLNRLEFRDEISAGGWSDLHPTMVLKAYGCQSVVYLTRRNGDSVFGQQVFIRLTGLQSKIPFWQQIGEKDPSKIQGVTGSNRAGWLMKGLPGENTAWDLTSNLGNKRSSFNNSLRNADVVYCTNWDHFDMFKLQQTEMVEEAYQAPVFLKPGAPSIFNRLNVQRPADLSQYPGCFTPEERGL